MIDEILTFLISTQFKDIIENEICRPRFLFHFPKGRAARNDYMHSRYYQMTSTDLKRHCDIFIDIVKLIGGDSDKHVEKIEKVTSFNTLSHATGNPPLESIKSR